MPAHAILLLLALVCPAGAGVVSRDLFEPGDGLLTYDDVNHREWLDFSVTRGVPAVDLSHVLGESGSLDGFRLATLTDVWDLFAPGSGARLGSSYLNPNARYTTGWIELLGLVGEVEMFDESNMPATRNRYAGGLTGIAYDSQRLSNLGVLFLELPGFQGPLGSRPTSYGMSLQLVPVYPLTPAITHVSEAFEANYWLYRDAAPVPEPAGLCLGVVACLAALRLRAFA